MKTIRHRFLVPGYARENPLSSGMKAGLAVLSLAATAGAIYYATRPASATQPAASISPGSNFTATMTLTPVTAGGAAATSADALAILRTIGFTPNTSGTSTAAQGGGAVAVAGSAGTFNISANNGTPNPITPGQTSQGPGVSQQFSVAFSNISAGST